MIWSILIPTLETRVNFLYRVYTNLEGQIKRHGLENEIEILLHQDKGKKTIGQKRNELIQRAKGKYISFVDDDDNVTAFYINTIYNALQQDKDCVKLIGLMTTDGRNQKRFTHSLKYRTYFEQNKEYFRPPNHLNPIKKELAEKFSFLEKNFGEDTDWAMRLCNAGVLKSEAETISPLYLYLYRTRK